MTDSPKPLLDWDKVWAEYERRGWVAQLTLAEKRLIHDAVERQL